MVVSLSRDGGREEEEACLACVCVISFWHEPLSTNGEEQPARKGVEGRRRHFVRDRALSGTEHLFGCY